MALTINYQRLARLAPAKKCGRKFERALLKIKKRYAQTTPVSKAPFSASVKRSNSLSFYASREWRDLRYKALELHGATCQCCGATRGKGVRMHVDHIKPRSLFPELALVLTNLQILCEACNLGKSNKFSTDWRNSGP